MGFSTAFLIGYPLLQTYALWRCDGVWRRAAMLMFLVAGPYWAWSLAKVMGWSFMTDRNRAFIDLISPVPLFALLILLGAYEMTKVGKPSNKAS